MEAERNHDLIADLRLDLNDREDHLEALQVSIFFHLLYLQNMQSLHGWIYNLLQMQDMFQVDITFLFT